MKNRRCKTCKWLRFGAKQDGKFRCTRYPPTIVLIDLYRFAEFPEVVSEMIGCGEWTKKE